MNGGIYPKGVRDHSDNELKLYFPKRCSIPISEWHDPYDL